MLFLRKKQRLIYAVGIALLSFGGFANAQDSLHVKERNTLINAAESTAGVAGKHGGEADEVKSAIRQHIDHHVLDSHDFTLLPEVKTRNAFPFHDPRIA